MKISVASLLVIITLMLISNSCRSVLQVEKYPKTDCYSEKEYVVKPVTFSIILTGTASTQEAFLFKGSSLFKSRELSHIAVLVKHNNKSFLFDTGLGGNIDTQFKEMSFLHRQMFRYSKQQSVKQQLIANSFKSDSIKTIILSHLHWDHSSGIKDFSNATIYTTEDEYVYAKSEKAHSPAFLKSQFDGNTIDWKFLEFKKNKYKTFEESCDFFGDGSVVFVKLLGHTNGSIGMFINGQKRYFFTGDVTWSIDGFKRPSPKHFIPSKLVDLDEDELNKTIVKVHNLMLADPALIVIPAHDFDSQKGLKHFPEFQ